MAEDDGSHRAWDSPARPLHTARQDHTAWASCSRQASRGPCAKKGTNPSSVATGRGHRTHKGWCRRVCSLPQYF